MNMTLQFVVPVRLKNFDDISLYRMMQDSSRWS